ncbi:hypothetical protein L4C39_19890 [Vibrio clamense]|uniref:hypothetical protein n=1 Tax=Vibrio clamense TaxID=2910254 RepID=UPI003D22F808
MEKIYYDILPDYSVSVYVYGDWDLFKSFHNLVSWCDSEFVKYELVDITDTTYQERISIMGVQL